VLSGLQLPFRFDAGRLRAELAGVTAEEWSAHYNTNDYGGDWRGVALRSASGAPGELAAVAPVFCDTPLLDRCAYVREVLGAFRCPLKSVRLLNLAAGSFIREHSDHALDYEDGEVRLHVPVQTNPDVEFYLAGERLALAEGNTYYVNVNLPHRVSNRGAADRVHLVIDAEVNDWVREVFARSSPIERCPPSPRGIDAFRDAVRADAVLRDALCAIDDRHAFAADAVRLGRARGFDLDEGDVDAALQGDARPGPPGGLPYALSTRGGRTCLEWMDVDEISMDEPFFDDTARVCLRNPLTRFTRRRAPLESAVNGPPPAGFIFHMSRCGSTLAGRLLHAAGWRVVSEASAIGEAILGNAPELRQIVNAFGGGGPYVVKLDAWHIHKLAQIREAFPKSPWVFLFRDPAEVLVSLMRSPGRHALPGGLAPAIVGLAPEDILLPRVEWTARVLAEICRSAAGHRGGLYVDYRRLPHAVENVIAPHFGLALSAAQRGRMREAARVDAKRPTAPFTQDAEEKQREGAQFAELIARFGLYRLYAELRRREADPLC
jgi:Aspartyl/Asparaginyl beta-hydroxylase